MATLEELLAEKARRQQAASAPGGATAPAPAPSTPPAPSQPAPTGNAPLDALEAEKARRASGQPQQPPLGVTGYASDIAQSAAAGLRRGIEGIPGMPQDIANLAAKGYGWASGTDQSKGWDIPYFPSSEEIHQATSKVIGQSYEPKTTAGRYARTAGEFAPAFVTNPLEGAGAVATKLAIGAGAGLASEAAGQATEGTKYEPWARAGVGLLAGVTGHAAPEAWRNVTTADARAAQAAVEDAARVHGVNLTLGERTGDVAQLGRESNLMRGGASSAASDLLNVRRDQNLAALHQAMDTMQGQVAPTRGASAVDAANLLNQQVRQRAEGAMTAGGQGIETALHSGVMTPVSELRALPGQIAADLRGPTPYVPEHILGADTPIANTAMDRISTLVSQANNPNAREFSLAGAEHLRQQLAKLQAMPGTTDARALGQIRDSFENWLTNSAGRSRIDMAQIPPGANVPTTVQDVLAGLDAARTQYGEGARIARPRANELRNPGAASVRDIATTAHPEDTRRLFTPNAQGNLSGQATDALDRLVRTGATPENLDQVRGVVLDHLTGGTPGQNTTRIGNFIDNNPTAANQLFTPQELDNLRSWGDTNSRLAQRPGTYNPSAPGIISQLAGDARGALAERLALAANAAFGPKAAAVVYGAGKAYGALAKNRAGVSEAREALAPVDRSTLAQVLTRKLATSPFAVVPGTYASGQ